MSSFFKKIAIFGIVLSVMVSIIQCKTEKRCPFKPSPIFEKGLPHIVQYNFEQNGTQSLESLLLDSGVLLEIGQNVCESTRQEYRFMVKGDFRTYPDSLWLKEASRQLVFLSSFSEKQAPLKTWADVIENRRTDMKLGVDHEVDMGVFVRIDKIVSPEQSTLMLIFGSGE